MATAAWDATREQNLKNGSSNKGDVLYWMARDQRAADNWALLRAAALAKENGGKARVVFALGAITTERSVFEPAPEWARSMMDCRAAFSGSQ